MLVIVDYKMGNLHSVKKKLDFLKVDSVISSDPAILLSASKLILPGVGHFGRAMENLRKLNLIDALNEAVIEKKTPVLGICLGMQLMAKSSEEGDVEGLGWFDADVIKIQVSDTIKFKIPHIGWNTINNEKESILMQDIADESEFYFVHAYHMQCHDTNDILNTTTYNRKMVSAIEKNNIFGVQYHPEKSHEVGEKLISNFIKL
jgi:glutamine amidotransferase